MIGPQRPPASLSLDLDDHWSYLKVAGVPAWREMPSYLSRMVPHALEALAALGLPCTWFVVGADAAQSRHASVLREIVRQGHTIGNHSFHHEPWLHRYSDQALAAELDRTHDAIATATGHAPVGFRGPGYSFSAPLFEMLVARGYLYDASTLPSALSGLSRAYYLAATAVSAAQREERAHLFGSWRDGLRPLSPYRWRLDGGRTLVEIPVSTMPLLRLPFHMSYVLWLSQRSETVALAYLQTALTLCRATGHAPSLLLHPLDFLGGDEVTGLDFFPAMQLSGARKRRLVMRALRRVASQFQVSDLDAVGRALASAPADALRVRPVDAPSGPTALVDAPAALPLREVA